MDIDEVYVRLASCYVSLLAMGSNCVDTTEHLNSARASIQKAVEHVEQAIITSRKDERYDKQ